MGKCLHPRWLLRRESVLDDRVLSRADCFSLNYRQTLTGLTTFSFVFIARVTPLAPQTSKVTIRATAAALLVSSYWQFLQKEHVSAIFKVLGKGLNIPIKRAFLQMPRADEHHDKAPSCSLEWLRGAGLQVLVWPALCDDVATHWELREAGLTSLITCPKSAEVKTGFSFNVTYS